MINPIRLCEDLFDDKNLSYANLRSFSEDHLVRIANPDNNPGGIYNTLITDTTTKYTAYYGKITNKAVKDAIAEGTTVTRNNARAAAEEKISKLQGLTKYKFGETSAEYQELYPHGMDEYYQAREGDIGTLFDRFVVAATTHLDADFHDDVEEIDDLVDDFHSAYTARETVVTQVDVLATGKHTDRKALTVQLTKNFLIIASNNIDNADKFDDYYDPRFLPLTEEADHTTLYDDIISLNQVVNIPLPAAEHPEDVTFKFENPGTTVYRVYAASTTTDPGGPASFFDVNPGDVIEKDGANLISTIAIGGSTPLMNIKGLGPADGEYKITVTE